MPSIQHLIFALVLYMTCLSCQRTNNTSLLESPDKTITLQCGLDSQGKIWYRIEKSDTVVLDSSRLGITLDDESYYDQLSSVSASSIRSVQDRYETWNAKRKSNHYQANQQTFTFKTKEGKKLDIIFQIANDGVAFRYRLPGDKEKLRTITEEHSAFHLPVGTKAWLQPMAVAKSGWEQTNPSYEEHYYQDIPVGQEAPSDAGWVYPALFRTGDHWLLITEAALDSQYCATRLHAQSVNGIYKIAFPDQRESIAENGLLPRAKGDFHSPWRVITIGSLATIVESTLGLDVAEPAKKMELDFVKPGKASWSWINSKDDFIVYDEQKKYIDFAADMHWEYCLIDVNWDTKIGYDKIKELAEYAASKGVGLLLWYNSAGDWNTVKYTPKDKLLTKESRRQEFSRLRDMGIKGVKIDFFGGDGQSVIAYYHQILSDAADYQLLVNFHGATLPRGWSRTYPHLMTAEAVRGFEMITFGQEDADKEASHAAMLPFTRNAFDPMDFTPMNLHKIPTHVERKTTNAFELATAVLFLSGIQHYAESPEGMQHVAPEVKKFLRELPAQWDDVKFLAGYPGKYVVIARKSGDHWYIAGINGEEEEKELQLDLSFIGDTQQGLFITETEQGGDFSITQLEKAKNVPLTLKNKGGFVMKF